jgi:hypothetical protein
MVALSMLLATAALAAGSLEAAVTPTVASRDGMVQISVTGLHAQAAQVRILGGVASQGKWFGWVQLIPNGPETWRTVLRAPGFLGVYPVQVRVRGQITDTRAVVKILPRGFADQPAFFAPGEVAAWWARTVAQPRPTAIVSTTTWNQGFFTHRDPELNLLLKVAVKVPARTTAKTVYLSMARLRPTGPWRLLETVRSP